jgi:hypothetical protein
MRGLVLLSIWLAVALSIDAYAFGGQYRRAVLHEVDYRTRLVVREVTDLLTGPSPFE